MADTDAPTCLEPVLDALFTAKGTPVRFAVGQTLTRQGDPTHDVLALRTGAVTVLGRDEETVLARRQAPEMVGDLEALVGASPTTVVALTDVTALSVPGRHFRDLVDSDPQAALAVLRFFAMQRYAADQANAEQRA